MNRRRNARIRRFIEVHQAVVGQENIGETKPHFPERIENLKGMAIKMNEEKKFRLNTDETEAIPACEDTTAAEQAPFKVFATQEEYQTYFDRILGQRLKNARKAEDTLHKLEPMLQQLQHGSARRRKPVRFEDVVSSTSGAQNVIWEKNRTICRLLGNANSGAEESEGQTVSPDDPVFHSDKVAKALERDFSAIPEQDAVLYRDVNFGELAKDRKFLALLSNGLSVTEAYAALHLDEIAGKLAKRTGKQIIDNIIAKGSRPPENVLQNGISGNLSPNVAAMNNDEIDALLARAQRGENIML